MPRKRFAGNSFNNVRDSQGKEGQHKSSPISTAAGGSDSAYFNSKSWSGSGQATEKRGGRGRRPRAVEVVNDTATARFAGSCRSPRHDTQEKQPACQARHHRPHYQHKHIEENDLQIITRTNLDLNEPCFLDKLMARVANSIAPGGQKSANRGHSCWDSLIGLRGNRGRHSPLFSLRSTFSRGAGERGRQA